MDEIQKAIDFYEAQNENMERETWKPDKVYPAYEKNKLAIKALKKQIAQGPLEDDFCPSCGQKLDWSAVK